MCVHHRGFIGVLGVLGLWCHAHRECEGDTYHHLVIVADCCFAGIWGATLERIMKVEPDALKDTIKCSSSIQCRFNVPPTNLKHLMVACLHHYGISCTPLKNYFWRVILRSTSVIMMSLCLMTLKHSILGLSAAHAPSCKCFGSTDFFVYLHGKQLKEVQRAQQNSVSRRALGDACIPGTTSVVCPSAIALASAALYLQDLLQEKKCQERDFSHPYLPPEYQAKLQRVKESICTIEQSLAYFSNLLHEPEPRFRQGGYVLDEKYELTKASRRQLTKTLQRRNQERTIPPGVYVFRGGEGDTSLIVTPDCKQVILIDGTKTADCFKEAWESTLRYLP